MRVGIMIQIKETRNFVTRNFPLVWGRELREPTILVEGEFSARRLVQRAEFHNNWERTQ